MKLKYDPKAIRDEIKTTLGVDMNTYINKDAIEGLVDLLMLPKYIFSAFLIPTLILAMTYIVPLIFIIPTFSAKWFTYATLGLILCIANVITIGTHFTLENITNDITRLLKYITTVLTNVTTDAKIAAGNVKSLGYMNVLLLFKGVILVVINPTLAAILIKKVPLVGRPVAYLMTTILNTTVGRIELDASKNASHIVPELSGNYAELIILDKINIIITRITNTILFPTKFLSVLSLAALTLFGIWIKM